MSRIIIELEDEEFKSLKFIIALYESDAYEEASIEEVKNSLCEKMKQILHGAIIDSRYEFIEDEGAE